MFCFSVSSKGEKETAHRQGLFHRFHINDSHSQSSLLEMISRGAPTIISRVVYIKCQKGDTSINKKIIKKKSFYGNEGKRYLSLL